MPSLSLTVSRSADTDDLWQDAGAGQTTPPDLLPRRHRLHPRALNPTWNLERVSQVIAICYHVLMILDHYRKYLVKLRACK